MKDAFHKAVLAPVGTQGLGFNEQEFDKEVKVTLEDKEVTMKTGAIASLQLQAVQIHQTHTY